jgi:hypothetical protein
MGFRLKAKVEVAARMRAEGLAWDHIAARLGYAHGKSCERNVVERDRELWMTCFEAAVREWTQQMLEPLALETMRKLMAGADSSDVNEKKVAEAAAHSILGHAAKLRGMTIKLTGTVTREEVDADLIADARRLANRAAEGE